MTDDFNPMVGMSLAKMDVITTIIQTDEIRPIPAQFNMGPGTTAVVASSISGDDESLTVAKILDPEEYKDRYPDFGDRLLNSYVLCKYHEAPPFNEPDGSVGWFSRVKLIELPEEHYAEILGFIEKDVFPPSPPSWLSEAYDKFNVELSAVSPDTVPAPIRCPNCGKYDVNLHIEHVVSLVTDVGILTREGEQAMVPTGDHDHSCMSTAKLVCTKCKWHADVETKDVYASNNEVRGILGHH